jgi:hypothetical protein
MGGDIETGPYGKSVKAVDIALHVLRATCSLAPEKGHLINLGKTPLKIPISAYLSSRTAIIS